MKIYCDGLSDPNPGRSTWAFTDVNSGDAKYGDLGAGQTNNFAEYVAVEQAVKYARHFPQEEQIEILTDSLLAVNQISGKWKCKKPELAELRDRVISLMPDNVRIQWIPGAENKADSWTRIAFKEYTGKEAKIWEKPKKKRRKNRKDGFTNDR